MQTKSCFTASDVVGAKFKHHASAAQKLTAQEKALQKACDVVDTKKYHATLFFCGGGGGDGSSGDDHGSGGGGGGGGGGGWLARHSTIKEMGPAHRLDL